MITKLAKHQGEITVPLPTFIRNKIHHPENKTMRDESYTDEDLRNSIDNMIAITRNIRSQGVG